MQTNLFDFLPPPQGECGVCQPTEHGGQPNGFPEGQKGEPGPPGSPGPPGLGADGKQVWWSTYKKISVTQMFAQCNEV